MHYSTEPRDSIFVKDYGLLSFAKTMGKNLGKNISKNFSGKYSQKLLDHANIQSSSKAKDEAKGDLVGNKIANKITKVSKSSPQNNFESETVISKNDVYSQKKDNKLLTN